MILNLCYYKFVEILEDRLLLFMKEDGSNVEIDGGQISQKVIITCHFH